MTIPLTSPFLKFHGFAVSPADDFDFIFLFILAFGFDPLFLVRLHQIIKIRPGGFQHINRLYDCTIETAVLRQSIRLVQSTAPATT